MSTMQGTVGKPLESVRDDVRNTAANAAYSSVEGAGGPYMLVFRKGSSGAGRGSMVTVQLREASPSETEVTVSVEMNWAITDWGRSRRAARRWLDAIGAER